MKRHYILACVLSVFLRTHAPAQDIPLSGFGPPVVFSGGFGEAISAFDLDGDGDQDVLGSAGSSLAWFKNDGQGNLTIQPLIYFGRVDIKSVDAADIDGDGDLDIITGSAANQLTYAKEVIAWYENDGTGTFGPPQTITTQTAGVNDVTTADLDGDGDLDVLSSATFANRVAWYQNDGQGNFGTLQRIGDTPGRATSVFPSDIDGDGDADVVAGFRDKVAWYENDGTGTFGSPQSVTDSVSTSDGIAVADVDNDGDMDVLVEGFFRSPYLFGARWHINDGQGDFTKGQDVPLQESMTNDLKVADLDGDGDIDVISARDYGSVGWNENKGSEGYGPFRAINDQISEIAIDVADLDGDRDLDLISGTGLTSWQENRLDEISNIPFISSLRLIKTQGNQDVDILTIQEGSTISLTKLGLYEYNVQANVFTAKQYITRVGFRLKAPAQQGIDRTDRGVPYSLFADKSGDFFGRQAYAGDYTLVVTPYYYEDRLAKEVAGDSTTINFTFTAEELAAENVRLVTVPDGELLETLDDGDIIALKADQEVTIVADMRFPQLNSAEFFLDGPDPDGKTDQRARENFAPYSLFGDEPEGLTGQSLSPGEYELRVIPYLSKYRGGYAGPEEKFRFTITSDPSVDNALAYPVPLQDELTLRLSPEAVTQVTLRHAHGQVYEVPIQQAQIVETGVRVDLRSLNLPAGPYILQVVQSGEINTMAVTKE